MPASPKSRFGRFKGPQGPGDNEYRNPPDRTAPAMATGSGPFQEEDFIGVEPPNSQPGVGHGAISTRSRRSRQISGPANSSTNELEYKGT